MVQATSPPQSWPTTTALASPSAGNCDRQVHQSSGKPCNSRTSGPSPLSAMWNRVPLAVTARCDHGPSAKTGDPPLPAIGSPGPGGRRTGRVLVAAQQRQVLLNRVPGLAQPGDPAECHVDDQHGQRAQDDIGPGDDKERGPVPDTQCDQAKGQ